MTVSNVRSPSTAAFSTAQSSTSSFKASSQLQSDGTFKLTAEQLAPFEGFVLGLGESHAKNILSRSEKKIAEWIKANPNATKEQFDTEVKKTLMNQSLIENEMKNFLQKSISDLMWKMKEMASDRFDG